MTRLSGAHGGPGEVDLYWLPLGAGDGNRWLRGNGLVDETISAAWHRRRRQDLYHSAPGWDAGLVAASRTVIEPTGEGTVRRGLAPGSRSA